MIGHSRFAAGKSDMFDSLECGRRQRARPSHIPVSLSCLVHFSPVDVSQCAGLKIDYNRGFNKQGKKGYLYHL